MPSHHHTSLLTSCTQDEEGDTMMKRKRRSSRHTNTRFLSFSSACASIAAAFSLLIQRGVVGFTMTIGRDLPDRLRVHLVSRLVSRMPVSDMSPHVDGHEQGDGAATGVMTFAAAEALAQDMVEEIQRTEYASVRQMQEGSGGSALPSSPAIPQPPPSPQAESASPTDEEEATHKRYLSRCRESVYYTAKCIHASPEARQDLSSGAVDAALFLDKRRHYMTALRSIRDVVVQSGKNMTKHHERVRRDGWEESMQDTAALQLYASNMKALSVQSWIRGGYAWCDRQCTLFGMEGGVAKRIARKVVRREFFEQRGMSLAKEDEDEALREAGFVEPLRRGGLALLDVGSCFNPFRSLSMGGGGRGGEGGGGAGENTGAGDGSGRVVTSVMALDLCPADPSVYTCDFLKLRVGPEGSPPVVQQREKRTAATEKGGEEEKEEEEDEEAGTLQQLPAASFDVCVLSLVLSYVPEPSDRTLMVQRCRELLTGPTDDDPLRSGLLLIVEPNSSCLGANQPAKREARRAWVSIVESLGFAHVDYASLGRSFAMAFHTIPVDTSSAAASSSGPHATVGDRAGAVDEEARGESSGLPPMGIKFDDREHWARVQQQFEARKVGLAKADAAEEREWGARRATQQQEHDFP